MNSVAGSDSCVSLAPNRLQVDAIEFIKTTPSSRGCDALEKLAHGLNLASDYRPYKALSVTYDLRVSMLSF